jgi:two-component system, NarL family, response regulator NreC
VLAVPHALMRRSLRVVLDRESDLEVIAEPRDLASVARVVRVVRPRVLVLDLSMSNGSSLDAIRRLSEELPGTAIVVLTMESSRVFARATSAAGAIGFVVEHAAEVELPAAVRRAAAGQRYLSPRVGARLGEPGAQLRASTPCLPNPAT